MSDQIVKVLLIEDDPMVQEINRSFISQLEGVKIIGIAPNGIEAIELIRELQPDLAIIDVYLPKQDGIETLKQLRAEGHQTDVIMITAANDLETVKTALQHGALDYIVKPFTFDRLQQAFEKYLTHKQQFHQNKEVTQAELDTMLFQMEQKRVATLPKGLNAVTLDKIKKFLEDNNAPHFADEVAEALGIARVTARRYLEYLAHCGIVEVQMEYQKVGRPKNSYQLK